MKGEVNESIKVFIYNKEKIVAQKCATGKVYGEVWYLVSLDMPVNYKEENVTGRVKKQLEFKFLNKEFHLFSHFKSYKRKSYSIISNNLLPISLDFTSYFETKVKSKTYTLDNIEKDAILERSHAEGIRAEIDVKTAIF